MSGEGASVRAENLDEGALLAVVFSPVEEGVASVEESLVVLFSVSAKSDLGPATTFAPSCLSCVSALGAGVGDGPALEDVGLRLLAVEEETTGLGTLVEVKWRPPPEPEEKNEEYDLRECAATAVGRSREKKGMGGVGPSSPGPCEVVVAGEVR